MEFGGNGKFAISLVIFLVLINEVQEKRTLANNNSRENYKQYFMSLNRTHSIFILTIRFFSVSGLYIISVHFRLTKGDLNL